MRKIRYLVIYLIILVYDFKENKLIEKVNIYVNKFCRDIIKKSSLKFLERSLQSIGYYP